MEKLVVVLGIWPCSSTKNQGQMDASVAHGEV